MNLIELLQHLTPLQPVSVSVSPLALVSLGDVPWLLAVREPMTEMQRAQTWPWEGSVGTCG